MSIIKRIGIWLGLEFGRALHNAAGDWLGKLLADLAPRPAPAIPDREIWRAIARHMAASLKLEIAAQQFVEVVMDALQNG